ncbi:MAG: HEPN domain-containing protein [Bryobacteraceae bacterium]|nr:HEPN domain-containing protein [Bryobacteraceae bacterium]
MDRAAPHILFLGGGELETVAFHIQQAAEKLLKSLLAEREHPYPRSHDLAELIALASSIDSSIEEFAPALAAFTPFSVAFRYEDAEGLSREDIESQFLHLDSLKERVYGLLPFEAIP